MGAGEDAPRQDGTWRVLRPVGPTSGQGLVGRGFRVPGLLPVASEFDPFRVAAACDEHVRILALRRRCKKRTRTLPGKRRMGVRVSAGRIMSQDRGD